MITTDSIADMLTRIRNAIKAKHDTVVMPTSKMKESIADILLTEGYIAKKEMVIDGSYKNLKITLKYNGKESIIQGLRRISTPGLRVYSEAKELPKVLSGLGIAIISTSKGLMTDKTARKLNVGGEVVAYIW